MASRPVLVRKTLEPELRGIGTSRDGRYGLLHAVWSPISQPSKVEVCITCLIRTVHET